MCRSVILKRRQIWKLVELHPLSIIACIDPLGEKVNKRRGSYRGTLSWLPKGKDLGVPKVLEEGSSWVDEVPREQVYSRTERERQRERWRKRMGRRRSNIIYWSGNHQIFWRQTTLVWWIRTYWETSMSNWLDFAIKLTEGILENARNYWNESKSRSGNLKMGNISNSQKIVYFLNIQVSSLSKWISLKNVLWKVSIWRVGGKLYPTCFDS